MKKKIYPILLLIISFTVKAQNILSHSIKTPSSDWIESVNSSNFTVDQVNEESAFKKSIADEIELIGKENLKEEFNKVQIENIGYPSNEGSFLDERDNRTYKTIKLGNQIWLAENLAYKIDTGCWAYNNNENNAEQYGFLYNWETAKNVCPSGWHLPSVSEWDELASYLGGNKIAGGQMKDYSNSNWKIPKKGIPNNSGFSAIAAGGKSETGKYFNKGDRAFFWTATHRSGSFAYLRSLWNNNSKLNKGSYTVYFGLSVRCVQDR